jgi:hypothetical protein
VEGIAPSSTGAGKDAGGDPLQPLALQDSFAPHPSGRQVAILQPISGDQDHSRLSLLDLENGRVLRSLILEAGSKDQAPLAEWMGSNQLFVWPFQSKGPLLVDLAVDPPAQTQVISELLGLDLAYPEQISSAGAFNDPASGSLHFVLHMNLPTDPDIYLYHGENGQVERLAGDRPRLMFFPGGQLMPLVHLQSRPPDQDTFELFWVDRPDLAPIHWVVSGHLPRTYPTLQIDQIPEQEALLLGSSQGISQVGLPGGEVQAFWPLGSGEEGSPPSISISPDGRSMIVTLFLASTGDSLQGQRLYWIDLEQPGS